MLIVKFGALRKLVNAFFSCFHIFDFVDAVCDFALSTDDNKGDAFFVSIGELFSEFIWMRIEFKVFPLIFEVVDERESGFKTIFKIYNEKIRNRLLGWLVAIKDSAQNSANPDTSSNSAVVLPFRIDIASEVLVSSSTTD